MSVDPVEARERVVLVVDDDETFAEMLTWSLERRGFRPVVCATAESARDALGDPAVGAIVCDIELGAGVIGTALVNELRRQTGRRIPAVFVSGYRAEFVHLDDPRDGFLQKPFSFSDLADLLEQRLPSTDASTGG